ncbi:GNAT family N-acetyltransferase [Phenylobacterium sp.]|uniref:GNAT family N-acetyltransferase n=1 Tax=Phenylobacterium sp. TaxID=1871053 RepID=UPI0025F5362F|nr:GNAT family N-acetyltransferase [Phenylobacterium sp.]
MQIEIRPCGPGDAAALALVGQATFLETYAHVLPGADIVAHCEREHGADRYAGWLQRPEAYRLWGAEVAGGGPMVGYVMLSPPDLPVRTGPPDLEIKRIYLLSRFHGGGVGARLMQTALEGARALGARRVLLGVFGENASAIAFYARQGFTEAGVRKFRVGANTYDDLVLAKDL